MVKACEGENAQTSLHDRVAKLEADLGLSNIEKDALALAKANAEEDARMSLERTKRESKAITDVRISKENELGGKGKALIRWQRIWKW